MQLYVEAARAAQAAGLDVNAGHDLSRENLTEFLRAVPGSFYEFITRAELQASPAANDPAQGSRLDLTFDAGNATGIFGMTAARA